MNVKQLIEELQKHNPDMPVLFAGFGPEGTFAIDTSYLNIETVTEKEMMMNVRGDFEEPQLNYPYFPTTKKVTAVILE